MKKTESPKFSFITRRTKLFQLTDSRKDALELLLEVLDDLLAGGGVDNNPLLHVGNAGALKDFS